MWRFLNNISRAFKSHVHSPRPSAGLYVEEEQEALELNEKAGCPFLQRRRRSLDADERQGCRVLNSLFVNKRANNEGSRPDTTCRIKHSQDVNTEEEHEDQQRWSCHHNFWRMFQGSHRMLEAISWGSAMLLGTDAEKRRNKSRLLLRVLLAAPGNSTTIRGINSSVSANVAALQSQETGHRAISELGGAAQDAAANSLEADTLDSALEEFQCMCTEYTARTESLLGIEAAVHGDYRSAVEHLRSSCALGNMSACFNLGLCYETGSGVLQDLDKAKHYYKLAAMEGHSMALYNLALLTIQCSSYRLQEQLAGAGCDCGCNKVQGLGLMERAAKLGLAKAQTYLGIHHIQERHDVGSAVPYFTSAAEQNDMNAQYFLAICYEQGWGVEANETRAGQLYSQATAAGHEMAMYNLAMFREHGLGGVPEDKPAAIELYQKAADLGCEQARQRLEDMKTSETAVVQLYQKAADRSCEQTRQRLEDMNAAEDWKRKIESFRQLYRQHHKDEDALPRHHHDNLSLSPSASSPNLSDYFHRDTTFFGSHIPQSKKFSVSFGHQDIGRRDSHLGSDGDYDDDSTSPHSPRSGMDESFESTSYEMFPSFHSLHKSYSHPNFSLVACNI